MTCCNPTNTPAQSATQAAASQCGCQQYRPAVDIVETNEAYTVSLDMPGCTPESIDVQVEGTQLNVTGKVRARHTPAPGSEALREYGVGDFARSFRVGTGVDLTNIQARYELGVLTLRLPKAEQARTRRITVSTNN